MAVEHEIEVDVIGWASRDGS